MSCLFPFCIVLGAFGLTLRINTFWNELTSFGSMYYIQPPPEKLSKDSEVTRHQEMITRETSTIAIIERNRVGWLCPLGVSCCGVSKWWSFRRLTNPILSYIPTDCSFLLRGREAVILPHTLRYHCQSDAWILTHCCGLTHLPLHKMAALL